MKHFDPSYVDLPDYILKVTKEIWEDRGVETLRRSYSADIVVRTPGGITRGNEAVIASTLATLAEFPDRQLYGEDVIWSGDEEAGFLSSHRLLTTGSHRGHGLFGPPTGRQFTIRALADCSVRAGVIDDEWLIRDSSGIALQLGHEPVAFVRAAIAREGGAENAARPFTPEDDVPGPYTARGNDDEWGARLADILSRIMAADIAVIRRDYDRAVRTEHPGFRGGWSWDFAEARWMGLRAAFPSATFAIHHVIGRADPNQPPRAAVRWSLDGSHDGFGHFGAPTGARVHVMGITHAEWGPWGLRREFTLFDELAIWRQILLATGST